MTSVSSSDETSIIEAIARVLWSATTSESWDDRLLAFPDSLDIGKTRALAQEAFAAARVALTSLVEADVRADERAKSFDAARKAITKDAYPDVWWFVGEAVNRINEAERRLNQGDPNA